MYVLIVFIILRGYHEPTITVSMQEFGTKEACERASSVVQNNAREYGVHGGEMLRVQCVPKG